MKEVTLSYPAGTVVFVERRPAEYDIQTALDRGAASDATDAVRAAIRHMFEETDALIIRATIHLDNMPSRVVAQTVGLREIEKDSSITYRRLTISEWLKSHASEKAEAKRPEWA